MKYLIHCERGNIAVIAAFSITVLLGFAALGLDVGSWHSRRQTMQSAADLAAVAGAQELGRGNSTDRINTAILTTAQRNGVPAERISWSLDGGNRVSVEVTEKMLFRLGNMITGQSPTIKVSAAAGVNAVQICMMSLAKTGVGVLAQGAAKIQAPGCNIQVNSTATDAITLQGAAKMTGRSICVAGDVKGNGFTPQPDTGCIGKDDPLASLPEPASADDPCNRLPTVTGTATPGIYCGGLNVVGDTVMQPGLYVVRLGNFTIGGNQKLTGDGVTIYLQGNASIQMSGGAQVTLRAPKTGPFAGVVIVSDRDPATMLGMPLGLSHSITGNSQKSYEGAIYLPKGDISFQGAAGSDAPSPFSIFIAHRISLMGTPKMTINNDYDATDIPLPGTMSQDRRAKLVQ